jgi:putative ABC transport system permease protein
MGLAALINRSRIVVPETMQLFLMQQHLTLAADGRWALQASLLLSAVTALASLLPAIWAARLKPVTAMHHIG